MYGKITLFMKHLQNWPHATCQIYTMWEDFRRSLLSLSIQDMAVNFLYAFLISCFYGLLVKVVLIEGRLQPAGAGYVGTGYNLLFGNNDGARFASGGPDPGLRLTNPVLRKTFSAPDDYCPVEAICTEVADGVTDDQFSLVADLPQYQKLFAAAWDFDSEEAVGLFSSNKKHATEIRTIISHIEVKSTVFMIHKMHKKVHHICSQYECIFPTVILPSRRSGLIDWLIDWR